MKMSVSKKAEKVIKEGLEEMTQRSSLREVTTIGGTDDTAGGDQESSSAWKGSLDDMVRRGLRKPMLTVIDGCPGLIT